MVEAAWHVVYTNGRPTGMQLAVSTDEGRAEAIHQVRMHRFQQKLSSEGWEMRLVDFRDAPLEDLTRAALVAMLTSNNQMVTTLNAIIQAANGPRAM